MTALYEVKDLATRGNVAAIKPLVDSIINVAQSNPGSLATCGNVANTQNFEAIYELARAGQLTDDYEEIADKFRQIQAIAAKSQNKKND